MLDPAVQMPYHHPNSPVPHQFQVTEPKATLLAKQSEASGSSGELPWGVCVCGGVVVRWMDGLHVPILKVQLLLLLGA